MKKITLEICAGSLAAALEAQAGGADRIELCESLELGGVTPSPGTLRLCREKLSIPIHVLIRPRGGDFLYSALEFEVMKQDILFCKDIGMNGVVVGILNLDGSVDRERCAALKVLAKPMSISFHRAFDFCRDPLEALNDLIELGYERILTAGQQNTVPEGIELITKLVSEADGRIIIMPGSGVHEQNISDILSKTKASEIHTTARISQDGPMAFRKNDVDLSMNLNESGYGRVGTDRNRVRQLIRLISCMIGLFFYLSVANAQHMTMDLNQKWSFRLRSSTMWFDARVPGNLHTDLRQNGLIAEPYYGTAEKELQALEQEGVEYLGKFDLKPDLYNQKHIELLFEGIDTYANVWLNNTRLFTADNMFRSYHIDIKALVKTNFNELDVLIDPAVSKGKELAAAARIVLPGEEKVYTRKAAYQYGWDWGPRFVTAGIWRPVKIIAWNDIIIRDAFIRQKSVTKKEASLNLKTSIDCDHDGDYTILLKDKISGKVYIKETLQLKKGFNSHQKDFSIKNPRLWWCSGLGEAYLYRFTVEILDGKNIISQQDLKLGVRTIEVVQEADKTPQKTDGLSGSSFYFKLNGIPVFMKGANYIPPTNFMGSMDTLQYASILDQAIKSNMNMLRVWGGGNYESSIFYDLCDEKGLLIWQDFMFACAMYPGDSAFLKSVRKEAYDNVLRLRQHPCIALWCGNNEIDEGWKNWEWQKQFKYSAADSASVWHDYQSLFHKTLPDVLSELDPDRFYWSSSPSIGWGHKESLASGDSHYWGVWWGLEPFSNYEQKVGRFVSEYGFQAFPDLQTLNDFAQPADIVLGSEVLKSHQKHPAGFETIQTYMDREYKKPKDFEQYVYVSQLLQAGGIGRAIEAHRIARPWCMGSLYWQLNDCWPVISWSGMDYKNRWKALQYKVREDFAPMLIKAKWKDNQLDIYIDNQGLQSIKAGLSMELFDFNGKLISRFTKDNLVIPANNLLSLYEDQQRLLIPEDTCSNFLLIKLIQQEKCILQQTLYFSEPKFLRLPEIKLLPKIDSISGGFIVTLLSDKLAKNVWLRLKDGDCLFEENFFDLTPGEEKIIFCKTNLKTEEFKANLMLSSLVDSY